VLRMLGGWRRDRRLLRQAWGRRIGIRPAADMPASQDTSHDDDDRVHAGRVGIGFSQTEAYARQGLQTIHVKDPPRSQRLSRAQQQDVIWVQPRLWRRFSIVRRRSSPPFLLQSSPTVRGHPFRIYTRRPRAPNPHWLDDRHHWRCMRALAPSSSVMAARLDIRTKHVHSASDK
jgi:hypothetical protein